MLSYEGVSPDKTEQASPSFSAGRNTGGSIGVSLVCNVLTRREQVQQSWLVEQVVPPGTQYRDKLQQVESYFAAYDSSRVHMQQRAIA